MYLESSLTVVIQRDLSGSDQAYEFNDRVCSFMFVTENQEGELLARRSKH